LKAACKDFQVEGPQTAKPRDL